MTTRAPGDLRLFDRLIGISISHERTDMLARGLGPAHLREMLVRLARPLLRSGATLAYGGSWDDRPENFTFDLLELIAAEQADNSLGGPDTSLPIGSMVNHLSWPHSLKVTPQTEATWLHCCRIVRVTQELAGIPAAERIADADAKDNRDAVRWNTAQTLSAMRRMATDGMQLPAPPGPDERYPSMAARIVLGGKVRGYSGFLPGIFEEALYTLRAGKPLFVLGGFGGAAGALAEGLLGSGSLPEPFEIDWHNRATPDVARLAAFAASDPARGMVPGTAVLLDELTQRVCNLRRDLGAGLRTGLSNQQNAELLTSRDIPRVVGLVRQGLTKLSASGIL